MTVRIPAGDDLRSICNANMRHRLNARQAAP